jgi:photosystem II stability/assembly factor-like uncharacterized protein
LTPQKEDMFFNSMAFWDEKNGILLGDPVDGKFILFSTQDGGESWKELSPLQMPSALDGEIGFAASNSCLTIQGNNHVWFGTGGGSSARIFYSSDRGIHWNVTETPMQVSNSSSGIFSVAFCNENIGIAVGGDYQSPTAFSSCNIITTKDGGRNWQPFHDECFAGKYLSSVVWKSENSAVVVDGSGKVFNSVAITNDRGWAVGPNQNFAKF